MGAVAGGGRGAGRAKVIAYLPRSPTCLPTMTKFLLLSVLVISFLVLSADAFCGLSATAALAPRQALGRQALVITPSPALPSPVLGRGGKRVSTTLHVDTQFIIGGGVALVGFGAGAAM